MPFALTGFFMGYAQQPQDFKWHLLALVVLCMVFARNAAMGFNRWADREIDRENVRTKIREIPSGMISPSAALWFVALNALAFIVVTFFINPLCFYLSPVALLVVLGYSYTKRFTALCHLVLGLGLALAPVGAFVAVTGYFQPEPIILGVSVLTWVSGFDIIYALQDEEFDKGKGLHSIPAFLGKSRALMVSNILHAITAATIGYFSFSMTQNHDGPAALIWIAFGIFAALLVYQHLLVKPHDLSKVNLAFFTTNGIASMLFGCLVILFILMG